MAHDDTNSEQKGSEREWPESGRPKLGRQPRCGLLLCSHTGMASPGSEKFAHPRHAAASPVALSAASGVAPTATEPYGLIQVSLPGASGSGYTYRFPSDLSPQPGIRVLVPWRNQQRVGVVLGTISALPEGLLAEQVRPIACILDFEPLLIPELLELLRWAADYYHAGLGELLQCALPPDLIRPRRLALTEAGREELKRLAAEVAPSQLALPALNAPVAALVNPTLACLSAAERGLALPGALRRRAFTALDLQRAIRRGWIACVEQEPRRRSAPTTLYYRITDRPWSEPLSPARVRVRNALQAAGGELNAAELAGIASNTVLRALLRQQYLQACPRPTPPPAPEWEARPRVVRLNPPQACALHAIVAALDALPPPGVPLGRPAKPDSVPAPPVFLLHGVTGSGKTAVYLEAIAACLARGRAALLLAPEIGLTPALEADFEQAFPGQVAILHSGLSRAERSAAWYRIRRGEARVVIGTRSAVFSPLPNPGLIIVDEEHDASFKQQNSPRYHARDLALVRARIQAAVAVLGSATPALESYRHARVGKYHLLELPQRVIARPLPRVELVSMRDAFRQHSQAAPAASGLPRSELVVSEPLRAALAVRLERGEQSLVLINRRGYAPVALCRACGQAQACRDCSAPMTWHKRAGVLLCHLCGYSQPPLQTCPACGSEHLYFLGIGSEKVEEHLRRLFPAARLGRLDRDTVRGRRDFARILAAFRHGELDILLGTQMIAKGHDLPGVTLVGVIQADLSLLLPDFRAAERTFQLLTQVAGRAGRAALPGEVYLQTLFPEHYAVRAAAAADYFGFWQRECHFRRALSYPPFASLAMVQLRGPREDSLRAAALQLRERLEAARKAEQLPVRILGPVPALVARLKREYRFQLLLKSPRRSPLHRLLARLNAMAAEVSLAGGSLIVDIDPVTLD